MFITGGIGTGKTYTLQSIFAELKKEGLNNVAVTASTGLACKQIEGVNASTLHSWAGLRDGRYNNDQLLKLMMNDITFKTARHRIEKNEVLIIDEISMISASTLAQLDFICRSVRGSSEPFGGIQIIVCGDFRQLRPVPNEHYHDPGHYCFTDKAWGTISHVVILDKVVRQTDDDFIKAIHCLAMGGRIPDDSRALLEGLSRPLTRGPDPMYLFSRMWDVEMLNHDKIRLLGPGEKLYTSKQMGPGKCLKTFQAPHHLVLNVKAKVMLVVNLSAKLVNGSMGVVISMADGECIVDFDGVGRTKITPYIFTIYSQEKACDIASRQQLPLRLAYGLTIHRAQGMTLERVVVDASNASMPGQLATAVGRAVSMNSLQLLKLNVIQGSLNVPKQLKSVEDFYANCRNVVMVCHCPRVNRPHHVDEDIRGIEDDTYDQFNDDPLVDHFDYDDDVDEDDDHDDDDHDDDDNDHDLRRMFSLTMQVATEHDDAPLPPLALNVCLFDIREQVRDQFSCSETMEQKSLTESDRTLSDAVLHSYLSGQLSHLEGMYAPLTSKKSGELKHRDFHKVLKEYQLYIASQQYTIDLRTTFQHDPDAVLMRLLNKYARHLLNVFMAHKAGEGRTVLPATLTTDTVISNSSMCNMRYLAGMCVAKMCHKSCVIASNNIYKTAKADRDRVRDARRRVNILQQHIVPQSQISTESLMPETLAMINRNQNLREGLTHISDSMFRFFVFLDKLLGPCLNQTTLNNHKGEVFVQADRVVRHNVQLRSAWLNLFARTVDNSDEDEEFLLELMQHTITPYIHVRCDQFRKDMVSQMRETKTLEIRKAVWNGGKRKTTRNIKAVTTKKIKSHRRKGASSTTSASSTSDTICPICGIQYWDADVWVGCDNIDDCGTFVCRKCAALEDDEKLQEAKNSYWKCPLC
jgi:hypothetical protein